MAGPRLFEFFRPFHVIITRRVSEEEQVSLEAFAGTIEQATHQAAELMRVCREHRKASNEQIVQATRQQLLALEGKIENRGEECRALDQQIDEKKRTLVSIDKALKEKRSKLNGPAVDLAERRIPRDGPDGPTGA